MCRLQNEGRHLPFVIAEATKGGKAQKPKSEKAVDSRLGGLQTQKTQKPAKIRESRGCSCFGGGSTKD